MLYFEVNEMAFHRGYYAIDLWQRRTGCPVSLST
jgi:hypothetical protein